MSEIDYEKRILFCLEREEHLNDWEREFINDMADKDVDYVLSPGQREKIDQIYGELT